MRPEPDLLTVLAERPVVGIIRGCPIEYITAVGAAAADAGFGAIEVTVDSPHPTEAIAALAEALPRTWLEDPAWTEETASALAPHRERVTWDVPLHSRADFGALPFSPRCVNLKPSRFGSLRELLDVYALCERRGIHTYGGGQFELGPGRQQAQHLAALFHADAPNDLSPPAYHAGVPPRGTPDAVLAAPDPIPGLGPEPAEARGR